MATAVADKNTNNSEEYEVIGNRENGPNSLSSDFSFIQMPEHPPKASTLRNGNFVETNDFCSNDLTEEQLQKLTSELLDFNKSTQEKLLMNNMMMKEQISTISEWHNQVTSSVATQQLHLKEVEDTLAQCQRENAELREKLHVFESQKAAEESQDTVQEESKSDEDSKFQNIIAEKDALLSQKTAEVEQLKVEFEEMKQQYKKETDLEINSLKEKLQNQIKMTQTVKDLEKLLLESQTRLLEEKHEVDAEKIKHSETKKLYAFLQDKYEKTVSDVNKEKQKWASSHNLGPTERELLEQISSLNKARTELVQKLNDREVEVGLLKSEVDTMDILKTQVEAYKAELEIAHKDKDEAIAHSQALTLQLVELRAPGSSNNPGDSFTSRGADYSERRDSQQDIQPLCIECPICKRGFTDITAAENHVNSCLDSNGEL